MFDMYKHRRNPAYRIVVRSGADLPSDVDVGEWMIVRTGANKISSGAEENIVKVGYHLYKPVVTYSERIVHAEDRT
jgi:hypothetical protein